MQPAIDANLVRVEDDHLHFRHPLVRSAIEESSTAGERRAAHLAIASAITDIPDRRAWHRALSIAGEDDDIASELAAAGERALARGAAEPAFRALERAAAITSDPSRRSTRRIDAAELAYEIGQPDAVTRLIGAAGSASLSERDRLRALRLREAVERPPGDDEAVARLVVGTDQALALGDIDLAFALLSPAALRCFWGHPGDRSARMVLDGVDRLGRPDDPRTLEILGLTAPIDSFAAVEVVARSADDGRLDSLGVLKIAFAAHAVGDFVCAFELLSTAVTALRREGRLALLAQALTVRAWDGINVGRFAELQRDADEGGRLAEEAELPVWVTGAAIARAFHAGIHGDDSTALAEAAKAEPILMAAGVRSLLAVNQLARGVTHLASGRSSDAVDALARMFDPADTAHHPLELFTGIGYIAEAAALADRVDEVRGLLAPVELTALRSGAPALHGGLRFARAVLAKDDSAEARFHEAIAGDLGWPFATARLRLAYGEWLRRHRRIADSRPHLRSAVEIFEQLNVLAWAERGRQELRASGERVADARRAAARNDLSPQELQIARMAADGLTNREIAERLFLSHRTVGSHLYRIFPKLGIASRSELAAALDDEAAVFA